MVFCRKFKIASSLARKGNIKFPFISIKSCIFQGTIRFFSSPFQLCTNICNLDIIFCSSVKTYFLTTINTCFKTGLRSLIPPPLTIFFTLITGASRSTLSPMPISQEVKKNVNAVIAASASLRKE